MKDNHKTSEQQKNNRHDYPLFYLYNKRVCVCVLSFIDSIFVTVASHLLNFFCKKDVIKSERKGKSSSDQTEGKRHKNSPLTVSPSLMPLDFIL